jgi:hypothetical protein
MTGVFLMMAATAAPVPVAILGVEIGAPLTLHECSPSDSYVRYAASLNEKKASRRLDEPLFVYATPAKSACYQRRQNRFSNTPVSNEVVNLIYPSSEQLPFIVQSQTIEAVLVNGLVEFVAFETPGFQLQDEVLKALKAKFSAPDTVEPVPLQNGFGAKFDAIHVIWHPSPTITATYSSFAPTIPGQDRGKVTVGTSRGIAAYNADIDARSGRSEPTIKL